MNNVSGTKPYHRRTMLALPPLSNAIRETEAPGGFQALGDNRGFELPGEPAATLGLQVGHTDCSKWTIWHGNAPRSGIVPIENMSLPKLLVIRRPVIPKNLKPISPL